jgi:hypothetical protein
MVCCWIEVSDGEGRVDVRGRSEVSDLQKSGYATINCVTFRPTRGGGFGKAK